MLISCSFPAVTVVMAFRLEQRGVTSLVATPHRRRRNTSSQISSSPNSKYASGYAETQRSQRTYRAIVESQARESSRRCRCVNFGIDPCVFETVGIDDINRY